LSPYFIGIEVVVRRAFLIGILYFFHSAIVGNIKRLRDIGNPIVQCGTDKDTKSFRVLSQYVVGTPPHEYTTLSLRYVSYRIALNLKKILVVDEIVVVAPDRPKCLL